MIGKIFPQVVFSVAGTILSLMAVVDSIPAGAIAPKTDLNESWSFGFQNYPIEHQGNATLDIKVSYKYIDGIGKNDPLEYPEFTQIYKYIDNFLVNYPNETDFWEVLNKNLVTELLTKPIPTEFGFNYNLANVVDSLTVDLAVQPGSSNVPYPRASKVTGIPGEQVDLN
ncbi:hypothetical protein [Iningainema tapete]|uniref:Uncharacterized protein n=1 Tax=Iningainema tapete BLCC-T55 TaxID=2748662 RepID=A0A8J6XMX7_9CYAN|nr:hypothetical protein [Iningainema tapete]MBD2774799.1 hypothetical protein [Iningainema tapete BLCC-T55]